MKKKIIFTKSFVSLQILLKFFCVTFFLIKSVCPNNKIFNQLIWDLIFFSKIFDTYFKTLKFVANCHGDPQTLLFQKTGPFIPTDCSRLTEITAVVRMVDDEEPGRSSRNNESR